MQYHTEWKATQCWKTHSQAQSLLFSEKPAIRKLEGFHWCRWEERPWRGPDLPILTSPFTVSKTGQGTALKDSFRSVGSVEMDIVFQNSTAFSFITPLVSRINPLFPVFQSILFYAQNDEASMLRQSEDNSQRVEWHSMYSLWRADSRIYIFWMPLYLHCTSSRPVPFSCWIFVYLIWF